MVVEATGFARHTMPSVASALGFGGKLVLIGIDHGPVPVDTFALQKKCVSIYCSVGHLGGGFPAVIELHRSGRLDLSAMVTARFSLDDALAAVELLAARTEVKILIHPNDPRAEMLAINHAEF
jgi:threonine dehydrogenase-like Zn-dependent dehydrogenase